MSEFQYWVFALAVALLAIGGPFVALILFHLTFGFHRVARVVHVDPVQVVA